MTLTLGRGNGITIGNPGGITLATSRGALTVGGAGGVALRQGTPLTLATGDVVGVPTSERQVYVQADEPERGDSDWIWYETDADGELTGNEFIYDAEG